MTAAAPWSGETAGRMMRGREREWGAVLGLLASVEAGRPGVLLVEGGAGTGKTLLVEEAVRAATAHGLASAAGRAFELGRPSPAEPLLAALDERADADEPWVTERIRANLEKRAGEGPVLVSLDDLHWADPVTIATIQTVSWHLACHPVGWLLTRRAGAQDASARLFDLLERQGADRRELGPLSGEALAAIAVDVLRAKPDSDLLALADGAGGDPSLFTDLLTGLRDEGAVRVSGGRARLSSARLPDRVRAGVARRLGGLSPRTRHLLTVSAVLGRSFSPEDAADVLGVTPAGIVPGLEEAMASGTLVASADAMCFRQELVWRAIVESVPAPVRQALHRQIGELMIERRGAATSAASHLVRGVRAGDDHALSRLDEVIDTVLPRAPDSAAELALRALDLTGPAEPDRPERALTAVRALTASGRLDEAAQLARAAFALPMPAPSCARMRCLLSEILELRGDLDEAAEEASAALAEPCLPGGIREDAELALLTAQVGAGEHVRERAEAIVSASGEHGDALVAEAFVTLALFEWAAGRLPAGLALAHEAVRREASADRRRVHPRVVLAMLLTDLHRSKEARTVLASAGDDAVGRLAWAVAPALLRAREHLMEGRFPEAAAEAETALATCGLGPYLLVWSGLTTLAAATLRTGDVALAHRYVGGASRRAPYPGPAYPQAAFTLVAAQVTEARGGAEALTGTFGALCEEVLRHRWTLVADPTAAAWLVRVGRALGDGAYTEKVTAAVEDMAGNGPSCRTAAEHARGLLDGQETLLERAAATHAGPWARASATEDLALLIASAGEGARQRAVAAFDTALSGYEAVGAARDAARVRRRLRRLGVRRRHWSHAERPVAGWASLTDTERTVSELVAEGLTNRQVADQLFMSTHTVAFHLRHVFRKLAIGSRVELARLALQQRA
jgi:DNA-binding CsgD family transcriptional regulator